MSLDTASLLSALLYSPEAVDKDIIHDVVGNILLKVAVMEGKVRVVLRDHDVFFSPQTFAFFVCSTFLF